MSYALPGQGAYDRSRAEPRRTLDQETSDEAWIELHEVESMVASAISAASLNKVGEWQGHMQDARDLLNKILGQA